MSERVWVVLDKHTNSRGDGFYEIALLGTVARTRKESKDAYSTRVPHDWVRSGGGYDTDHQNGFVRVVRATLAIEQPKSKKRSKS
jgi:hypothetical protein